MIDSGSKTVEKEKGKELMETNKRISIIVPTLNEGENIERLMKSLEHQTWPDFETIIVDGGSKDNTAEIARNYNAKIIVQFGCKEFPSRNIGAHLANGEILLFAGADTVLPNSTLEKVYERLRKERNVIAVSGPGMPYDAPLLGKVLYRVYNSFRYLSSQLPKQLRRFSTSTNFLAVRKEVFEKTGGFNPEDINADGLMGKKLSEMGKVEFCLDAYVYISARRMKKMGFLGFILHYLYVLENFYPFLSHTGLMKNLKKRSENVHSKMHE